MATEKRTHHNVLVRPPSASNSNRNAVCCRGEHSTIAQEASAGADEAVLRCGRACTRTSVGKCAR